MSSIHFFLDTNVLFSYVRKAESHSQRINDLFNQIENHNINCIILKTVCEEYETKVKNVTKISLDILRSLKNRLNELGIPIFSRITLDDEVQNFFTFIVSQFDENMQGYIRELERWIVTVVENEFLADKDKIDSDELLQALIKKFYVEGFQNLKNGLDAILAKNNFCMNDTIVVPLRLGRAVNTIIEPQKDAYIYSECVVYAFDKNVLVFLITNNYEHLLKNSQGLYQRCPFVRICRPLYAITRYHNLKNQRLPKLEECDWHTLI